MLSKKRLDELLLRFVEIPVHSATMYVIMQCEAFFYYVSIFSF